MTPALVLLLALPSLAAEIPEPTANPVAVQTDAATAAAAQALIADVVSKGDCATTCSVVVPKGSVTVDFVDPDKRTSPYSLTIRRDVPAFKVGVNQAGREEWAMESHTVILDAAGAIIEAFSLVPARSLGPCADCVAQQFAVQPADQGFYGVVTVYSKRVPLSAGNVAGFVMAASRDAAASLSSGAKAQAAAQALIGLVRSKGSCYDGSDPEVHGAPMCAVSLSSDLDHQWYVYVPIDRSRGHGDDGGLTLVRGDVHIGTDGEGNITMAERWGGAGRGKLSVAETRAELEAAYAAVKAK